MTHVHPLDLATPAARFELDVREGLGHAGQKTLPCKYFYDEVGSLLFEAICALPEYGLTAADAGLLQAHADEMLAPLGPHPVVAELGSGSGSKTRWLLEALRRRSSRLRASGDAASPLLPLLYAPIEISASALERCQDELAGIEDLEIRPLRYEYLEGLEALSRSRDQRALRGRPLLLLFLGSTLGNFDPGPALDFLQAIRRLLRPGDALLLGLDLVKPRERLLLAYDDPAGVTAAFNLNLLARINRELGANFDLRQWRHLVRYRRRERRVEMHLRSRREQTVRLEGGAAFHFRRGETIWTESSYKFEAGAAARLAAGAGFRLQRQWRDPAWQFAENLLLAD